MANHLVKSVYSIPVLLSPPSTHSGVDLIIQNNSGSSLFIGASDVTTSNYGFSIASGSAISLHLPGKEEIYGITNSASPIDINVLTIGLV
jgi:hypothetical protein